MREEITEPQHWRTSSQRNSSQNQLWSSRRRTHEHVELAAEAVDAALAESEAPADDHSDLVTSDIIGSLASQLDLLEKQREQLQRLLEQAQASK